MAVYGICAAIRSAKGDSVALGHASPLAIHASTYSTMTEGVADIFLLWTSCQTSAIHTSAPQFVTFVRDAHQRFRVSAGDMTCGGVCLGIKLLHSAQTISWTFFFFLFLTFLRGNRALLQTAVPTEEKEISPLCWPDLVLLTCFVYSASSLWAIPQMPSAVV